MKVKADYLYIIGLVLILTIGTLLRFATIVNQSLDGDESYTLALSRQPVSQIFEILMKSPTGPVYYFFMHFWLRLGTSDLLIRLPSLIFGILTIIATYLIGKELLDKRVAILASLLLSVSALHIFYSQFGRVYSLAACVGTVAIYYFIRGITRGNVYFWVMHTLVGIIMLYTFPYLLGLIIAEFIFVVGYLSQYRGIFKRLMLSQIGIIGGFIPLFFFSYLYVYNNFSTGTTDMAWISKLYPLSKYTNLWKALDAFFYYTFKAMFADYGYWGPVNLDNVFLRRPLFLAICLLMPIGLFKLYSKQNTTDKGRFLFLWLFIPLVLGYLFSVYLAHTTRQYSGYYYLFLVVPFYLIISFGVMVLYEAKGILKWVALGVIALFVAGNIYSYLNMHKATGCPDYKGAVSFIDEKIKADETVFCYPPALVFMIEHYKRMGYPVKGIPRDYILKMDYETEGSDLNEVRFITEKGLEKIQGLIKGHKTLWFFYVDSPYHDPEERIKKWFLEHMELIEDKTYTLYNKSHRGRIELFHLKNRLL